MAGAINYTYWTDSSADWGSIPTSTYFYDKADKLVHYKNSAGAVLEVFSAAGLVNFAEAQNTAAPNATVPVDSLTAVASTTDADFAIIPKGAGAIIADIPDGLVTGGNKRGQYAVDLQMARLTNASVASGNYSVISGGNYNTASGATSSIGGGYQNTAAGTQSTIGGGNQNGASTDFATVGGGTNNTASGSRSIVAGGASSSATAYSAATLGGFSNASTGNYSSNLGGLGNSASADGATALGGASNVASGSYSIVGGANSVANSLYGVALGGGTTTNGIVHRQVYGVRHTVSGDAQSSTFIMRMRTSDATLTTLTSEGTTAASNNQVILPNNGAFRFKGTIIAKQSGSTNVAAWDIDGLIVRGANAGTTTLNIGNVTLVQNTPGWGTPTLAADTTQGGLRIQIQGAAGTNIQWVGDIKTTEVIYA